MIRIKNKLKKVDRLLSNSIKNHDYFEPNVFYTCNVDRLVYGAGIDFAFLFNKKIPARILDVAAFITAPLLAKMY